MNRAQATSRSGTALVALLEQTSFGDAPAAGAARATVGPTLPDGLWERALRGPLRELLSRPGKQFRARLVALCWELAGGAPGAVPPELPLLIESLHAGSLIIDDIEDGSELRRGAPALHRLYGTPLALNAGNWLYFWPAALLARMRLPDAVRLRAYEQMSVSLLRCHEGQALDLALRVPELAQDEVEPVARAIAGCKSGGLLGLATALGAIAAQAEPAICEALAVFGREVGVGLQMLDDLSGVVNPALRAKAEEDLAHGKATWPWAWMAQDLDPASYEPRIDALREVMAGGASDSLLEEMRFRVGVTGRRRVRRQLEGALDALRAATGNDAWVEPLRRQLLRLEQSYVGA